MAGYLCGRCRSDDCSHIDPRLKEQLKQRQWKEYFSRIDQQKAMIGTPMNIAVDPGSATGITVSDMVWGTASPLEQFVSEQQMRRLEINPVTDKKLLLLRRRK